MNAAFKPVKGLSAYHSIVGQFESQKAIFYTQKRYFYFSFQSIRKTIFSKNHSLTFKIEIRSFPFLFCLKFLAISWCSFNKMLTKNFSAEDPGLIFCSQITGRPFLSSSSSGTFLRQKSMEDYFLVRPENSFQVLQLFFYLWPGEAS
jgi:hypothetical protein